MAGKDDDAVTAAEFAEWIPAAIALERVAAATDWNIARSTIVRRLAHEQFRACGKTAILQKDGKAVPKVALFIVPPGIWKKCLDRGNLVYLTFWSSPDWVYEGSESSGGYSHDYRFTMFDVRFEPSGIDELAPLTATKAPVIPPDRMPVLNVNQQEDEPPQKGKPPSEAAMAAWYEAYKVAYTGAADTEAKALESARGCFPDKTVSREAVRRLRGEQKRGRKGESAI